MNPSPDLAQIRPWAPTALATRTVLAAVVTFMTAKDKIGGILRRGVEFLGNFLQISVPGRAGHFVRRTRLLVLHNSRPRRRTTHFVQKQRLALKVLLFMHFSCTK